MAEFGIFDTKQNKLIRVAFSEGQADSYLKVHHDDMTDAKKKPFLVKAKREIGEWQKLS